MRNLYCEMVSLSERLMKMSANEMSFAKWNHFYLQSNSESANQDINLISSREGRLGYGHFLHFIRKHWKDNYSQNPYYLYNGENTSFSKLKKFYKAKTKMYAWTRNNVEAKKLPCGIFVTSLNYPEIVNRWWMKVHQLNKINEK